MSTIIPQPAGASPFDAIRQVDEHGGDFWSARQLQPLVAYRRWEDFKRIVERAKRSAVNSGHDAERGFSVVTENLPGGTKPREDYRLTRFAAYLVAMNGDPNKKEVAAAQAYFAYQTRKAELADAEKSKPREITAAAGPVPYKEQAEILAILRPMLPEAYATATGKVILARSMGERPELDSSETPLYASTFLAEKGLSRKAVSKFESPFGLRVSNRYLKVHGRRPEKIPGPAGSRIDKVVAYTEDDRPLLEQVFADIADMVEAFEVDLAGGQLAMVGGAK